MDRVGGYVLVANSLSLNPSNAITIEAWFAATHTTGDPFLVGEFNHHSGPAGNPSDDSYALGLDVSGSLYWQVVTIVDGSGADNIMVVMPPVEVYDEQLHHIAATYDGAMMTVYLDGSLLGSRTTRGTIAPSSSDLVLGAGVTNGIMTLFHKGLWSTSILTAKHMARLAR